MLARFVTGLFFVCLISRATYVAAWSVMLAQRVLMNFMAKVVSPIRVIPQIHSNSDGILILRVVNPTFLNPVGSKLQKQALKGSSTTNVAVMDVSWYVMEYALVAQGHCFRASMWARSSMECLSVFEIPWSSVTNKFCKFPKTPRPYPTPGPAATTFDYMMVLVMVHLVNKPVSDVWSTPGMEEWFFLEHLRVSFLVLCSNVSVCGWIGAWMDGRMDVYWVGGYMWGCLHLCPCLPSHSCPKINRSDWKTVAYVMVPSTNSLHWQS